MSVQNFEICMCIAHTVHTRLNKVALYNYGLQIDWLQSETLLGFERKNQLAIVMKFLLLSTNSRLL